MTSEKVNWIKIKNEYINTSISQRKLSAKYQIPYQTLRDRATKEKWFDKQKEQQSKIRAMIEQKTAEKIAECESDRVSRIGSAVDRLLDKVEEAIGQLDNHIVKNKNRIKTIEYHDTDRPDKPVKEYVQEFEEYEVITGVLDKAGLKLLAGALKDIKDISGVDTGEDAKLKEVLEKIEGNI